MKMLVSLPRLVREQTGDTIVEVVIAMAVVSTMLTGAFVVTSNSMKGVRDSEEHAHALQLLQGQVELLRSAASQSGDVPTSGLSSSFCFDAGGGLVRDPNCTTDAIYHLSISSPTDVAAANVTTTFNLTASWPSVNGGNDQVLLSYKVVVTP